MFDTFVTEFKDTDLIDKYTNSYNNSCIYFKDGTIVRFIPIDSQSRGRRFTKSYIQGDVEIDNELIEYIVLPCCRGELYVIDEYEDLFKQQRSWKNIKINEEIDKLKKEKIEYIYDSLCLRYKIAREAEMRGNIQERFKTDDKRTKNQIVSFEKSLCERDCMRFYEILREGLGLN